MRGGGDEAGPPAPPHPHEEEAAMAKQLPMWQMATDFFEELQSLFLVSRVYCEELTASGPGFREVGDL
jgi:hypothetical protein